MNISLYVCIGRFVSIIFPRQSNSNINLQHCILQSDQAKKTSVGLPGDEKNSLGQSGDDKTMDVGRPGDYKDQGDDDSEDDDKENEKIVQRFFGKKKA